MRIGSKKIGVVLLVVAVALMMGVFGLPRDADRAEADLLPGATVAVPAALPGITPATAPASGPGNFALVNSWCDPITGCPTDPGFNFPLDFTITRIFPTSGDPAATFAANGTTTLVCRDGAACDLNNLALGVAVQVNGGGENEMVAVQSCDRSGSCLTARIIFVETILALAPTDYASGLNLVAVAYHCSDVGLGNTLAAVATAQLGGAVFTPVAGYVGQLYGCGGNTVPTTDDRVTFETDAGILTNQQLADLSPWLANGCAAGDSVDIRDHPGAPAIWCDLDGAYNGAVSYGLLGTGDVGVATVTAQQSGGVGPLRTINVTFAGAAALSLFISAPALVGLEGADFNVMIVDQDGRPIEDETVECSVTPTGGALIILPQTGTSDAAGNVAFTMIPTGASVVGGEELTINCHLDSNPDVKASTTVNLTTEPALEAVDLVEGCNPVASTWADGTAADVVAGAVAPADALNAIWAFDTATGTWLGYSPTAPAAVSDLKSVNMLDAIFICVDAAATVSRPVI